MVTFLVHASLSHVAHHEDEPMAEQPLKFVKPGDEEAIDIGPHGYTEPMTVYWNDGITPDLLKEWNVTKNWADHALAVDDPHLVGFSSAANGTGNFHNVVMPGGEASLYPKGTDVTFHFKKDREIGFGTLVAVSFAQSAPAPAPR
jgi:hypothetical protein